MNAANMLMKYDIKALVIACNTATSVAIEELRKNIKIPVIGLEPALKPAVEEHEGETIAVMATPLTLKEKKFNLLMQKFNEKTNIIPLPCPGLVELIEAGIWKGEKITAYLDKAFEEIHNVSAIVLGCTHYIFLKEEIDTWSYLEKLALLT
jgi:glutamate racemase